MELPRFPAAAEHASRRRDDLDADALRIHLLTLGALVRLDGGPDLGLDRLVDAVRRYELGRDQLRTITVALERAVVARKVERRFMPRYPLTRAALVKYDRATDDASRLLAVAPLHLAAKVEAPVLAEFVLDVTFCRLMAEQVVVRGETFVDPEALEIYDDALSPEHDEDPS